MKVSRVGLLSLATTILWAAGAVGWARGEESLADASRRAKAREPRPPPISRPYTNADLAKYGPSPQTQRMSEPARAITAEVPQTEPFLWEGSDWGQLERDWRAPFAAARERLREAESRAWQDTIQTVFRGGVPVQMWVREQVETEELRQARQAIEDLQEQLRKSGKPPGWGRE